MLYGYDLDFICALPHRSSELFKLGCIYGDSVAIYKDISSPIYISVVSFY